MYRILILFISVLLVNVSTASADIDSFQKAEPLVEHILKSLDEGKYSEARRDFDRTMLEEFGVGEIKEFWEETKKEVGSLVSYEKHSLKVEEGYSVFQYKVKYTKGDLIATVTFDKDNKVAGLWFKPAGRDLSGEEREEAIQRAGPVVENIISSMDKGDYAGASRDFDSSMKEVIPVSAFKETGEMVKEKIGRCESFTPDICRQEGRYTVIKYKGKYSKEPGDVIITVSFDKDFRVAGLWFDSPKLKE